MKRLSVIFLLLMETTLPGFSPTYLSFNTGQISPLMEARIDFAKYRSSARTVENMLVTTQGPVFRRPGTKYIATQKDSTAVGRVVSFEHSVDDSYVLLLEDQTMRFFRDGGQILDTVGTEILTGGSKPGTANLVAHWLLNEADAVTVVDDNGATHNMTASTDINALAVDGKVGIGAFDLDGQYDCELADHSDFSFTDNSDDSAFSIACWGYVTEQTDSHRVLLSKWRNSSAVSEWRLSLTNDQKLQLHLADTSTDLTQNAVSQWKLNENAGNTSVVDTIGLQNGVSTVITSTLSATGAATNTSTSFDMDTQYAVEINDNAAYSFGDGSDDSEFSIAAWIFVNETAVTRVIVSKDDWTTGAELNEWKLFLSTTNRLVFNLRDNDNGALEQVYANISSGWHFIVATYDGTGGTSANDGMSLYIDGSVVSVTKADDGSYDSMVDTNAKVVIGAYYDATGSLATFYNDKIDNVIIYSAELSLSQISALWNSRDGIEALTAGIEIFSLSDDAVSLGWHFFTVTYSAPDDGGVGGNEPAAAGGIILYIDGAAVVSTAVNDADYKAMQNKTEAIRIGSQLNTGDTANEKFWADTIDEVSVFSDVLTPTEVLSLYATTPYEIETPYLTADLFALDFIKSEDVMYIAHPDYEPRQLSRSGHALWSLDALSIGTGPFQAENEDTALTITPAGTTYTADSEITLTAASDLFFPGHVNSIWQIDQVRGTSQLSGTFTANGNSISTPFFSGAYGFTTSDNSDGTITLMRSTNNGASWRPALTALTDSDFDNPTEIEEDGAIYRAVMSNFGSPGTNPTYTFTITDNTNKGVVRITGVGSGTIATAIVVTALVDGTATSNWRESYWSDYRGWPETVTIHQQRLTFGGSTTFPQTVWFGKTDPDDYTNFTEGTLDTSAFTVVLAGNNSIQWMLSQDYLLIGNSGSCGKYGDQGKPVTPTSPNYQEQTRQGAASLPAIIAGDAILYVERGSRTIREFVFDFQADKYLSPDLSVLSPEITESGIKDVAYQFRPYPILWCVLNNGDIATLTYQKNQSVVAWTKQITDGDFESITIIPNTTEDEVWVTVKRTIDGVTETVARYVEQFQPQDWGSDDNDAWFVDSGISYDGTATDTFTGADHLDGETLSIYADLLIESPEVVVSGGFTIDNAAERVLVGLPFVSKLETMPIVIDPQDKATNKRLKKVWFDLYKTGYMEFGGDPTATLINMNFNNNLDLDNTATAQDFVTSTVKLEWGSWSWGSKMKQTIYVQSDQPMPLTVRSITPDFNLFPN